MRHIHWFWCCQHCGHCYATDASALAQVQACATCGQPLTLRWSVLIFVPGDRFPQHRDFLAVLHRQPRRRAPVWHIGYTDGVADKAMVILTTAEEVVIWWQRHLVAITPPDIAH